MAGSKSATFGYTGQTVTYTVPETGLYGITAAGAQGGNATLSFNSQGLTSGPGSALAVLPGVGPGVTLATLINDHALAISCPLPDAPWPPGAAGQQTADHITAACGKA